jgi:hypothetical protein
VGPRDHKGGSNLLERYKISRNHFAFRVGGAAVGISWGGGVLERPEEGELFLVPTMLGFFDGEVVAAILRCC